METRNALIAAAVIIVLAAMVFIALPFWQADEHGCVKSAGYEWCEPLQKCAKPSEEECKAPLPPGAVPNAMDESVCAPSGGHVVAGACPEGEFQLAEVKSQGGKKFCCIEMPVPAPPQDGGGEGTAKPLPLPPSTGQENEPRP